jgi:hypothetical protein
MPKLEKERRGKEEYIARVLRLHSMKWRKVQKEFPGITAEGILIALREKYDSWPSHIPELEE